MTDVTTGIVGLGLLFVLLALRMPIAYALGLIGFAGYSYIAGLPAGLGILGLEPYETTATYALSVVALFVLMGQFVAHTGLSEDAYRAAHKWLGHLPGGIAMATIGACAAFAAVSGSSLATGATLGPVSLPELKRYKYNAAFASGVLASGATLGIMIPPSVILVFYGVVAEQSIGKLFLAGFLPGFLLAGLFMIYIYMRCRFDPEMKIAVAPRETFAARLISLKETWGIFLLFFVVMGGIYSGVFTPTEAGGIGAFGALIFAIARRKSTRADLINSLYGSVKTTAMLLTIYIGATIFTYFMAITGIPSNTAEFVVGLGLPGYAVMIIIVLIYIVLGCFLDSFGMIILTIPIFLPTIITLGYDPIWFGIIVVLVCEMGLITPPLGLNVFVIAGVVEGVSISTIFRGVVPFLFIMIITVLVLLAFPDIATIIPRLFLG